MALTDEGRDKLEDCLRVLQRQISAIKDDNDRGNYSSSVSRRRRALGSLASPVMGSRKSNRIAFMLC